ncbi:MAG: DUF5053 domain-containing protein [Prevotellaceae bacterium]|jgi:hypothetical protein|nr:DUF5053 domain-containing protein [Prevotellaceae bacterium]
MERKFKDLQNQWLNATKETQRSEIEDKFIELANENPDAFTNAYRNAIRETIERAKQLSIKEQFKPLTEIISVSYISKTYFGKSKDWLYQRINGYNVNGKPAKLKENEIETLNNALTDIAQKISAIKISG